MDRQGSIPAIRLLLAVILSACLLQGFVPMIAVASPGVIYACVNQHTGAVRIVATNVTCKKNETPITWNVTGPQGSQGPQGPAGAQGPQGSQGSAGSQGPSGLSRVYAKSIVGTVMLGVITTLGSLDLPAGNYLITARLNVLFSPSVIPSADCSLVSGATTIDVGSSAIWVQFVSTSVSNMLIKLFAIPLTLHGTISLATAGTVVLECAGAGAYSSGVSLTAIAVDELDSSIEAVP